MIRRGAEALDSLSICLSPRCGGGSVSAVGEGRKGGAALDSLAFASAEKRKAEAERIRIKVRRLTHIFHEADARRSTLTESP